MVSDDALKTRAEKLVDVYLTWIMGTDAAAGWHQPSMIQSLIEYRGCLPPPSGTDQADLKMIREIDHLRRPHALLSEAKELIGRLPKLHRTCLLVHARAVGTYDAQGKRWTEKRMAAELGLTVRQFRYCREAGARRLAFLTAGFRRAA